MPILRLHLLFCHDTRIQRTLRFDYDWERGTPVKFNDFFEFPMTLDMSPYTLDAQRAKTQGSEVRETRLRVLVYFSFS